MPSRVRSNFSRGAALILSAVACSSSVQAHPSASTSGVEPVVAAPSAPIAAAWAFPFGDARGEHVALLAGSSLDPEPLVGIAEDALSSTRAWLGLPPTTNVETLEIHLVDDVEDLFAIEAEHGLPSSRDYFRTHDFQGRCYTSAGLIVLPSSGRVGVRWQLVHEITHAVNAARTGVCPTVLDEGLAELVPYWILGSDVATPEVLDCEYELYDQRLGQAVLAREVPTLDRLLSVDDATFRDPAARWLWYALSWKLVKVMVESDDPLAHERFMALLEAVAAGHDLRTAVASSYDVQALETAWRRAIHAVAPWRPLFGEWQSQGDVLTGRAPIGTTSCATSARRLFAAESFEIGFSLPVKPADGAGFGFVFDAVDEANFVYVEIRPGATSAVVAERALGRWVRTTEYELQADVRAAVAAAASTRRFVLRGSAQGRLELALDGRTIVRHELNRALNGGALGVMVEGCFGTSSTSTTPMPLEVRFENVSRTR